MERSIEEVMQRVKTVYEMVTGKPAPEFSPDNPYARIPPEVDREEHVLRQAAALFERVRDTGMDVAPPSVRPFTTMFRDGNDLRFVFDVGSLSREQITVELKGIELRVTTGREKERQTRTAFLPVRVEPSAVSAESSDGFLTVRVRVPVIDDAIHKIEIR